MPAPSFKRGWDWFTCSPRLPHDSTCARCCVTTALLLVSSSLCGSYERPSLPQVVYCRAHICESLLTMPYALSLIPCTFEVSSLFLICTQFYFLHSHLQPLPSAHL